MVSVPRVYHLGHCGGIHFKRDESLCDVDRTVRDLREHLARNSRPFFYPAVGALRLDGVNSEFKEHKPMGGWADPRDHSLCRRILHLES